MLSYYDDCDDFDAPIDFDREELLRERRLERERRLREKSEEYAVEVSSRSRITRFELPPVRRYCDEV